MTGVNDHTTVCEGESLHPHPSLTNTLSISVCLTGDSFFADNEVLGFRFEAQSLWPGRIALAWIYKGKLGVVLKSVSVKTVG